MMCAACTVTTIWDARSTRSVFVHAQATDLGGGCSVEPTLCDRDVSGIAENCTHETTRVIDEMCPNTTKDDDE